LQRWRLSGTRDGHSPRAALAANFPALDLVNLEN
jgi:hypothetical protein